MTAELIDLDAGVAVPARARLDALVDEVGEVAGDLGIAQYLRTLSEPTAAEVYGAELEAGATVGEVWPRAVERTRESVVEWVSVREEGTG